MKLVIVESPTKARTLSRFLGQDYQVMASMGHLRDLPKSKLGVEVKKDYKPDYVEVERNKGTISKLKQAAKKAQEIILATDPDREGEAIAYHAHIICEKSKVQRISFHEITKSAVEHALTKPGVINMKLIDSQKARRVLDRLVGYKLSPLLWRKIRRGLSAGRVQSPAVRLIVEREQEIKIFKPEEYWIIRSKVRKSKEFIIDLVKIEDKKAEVKNKKQADEIIIDLKKAKYEIVEVKSREVKNSPPPPFITSTLQRIASSLFHWSAKKTMREAQNLYENGLITYHRTDSFNLAKSALSKVRQYIKNTFGQDYVPEQPRFYKTKSKLAQEAHEAIRPTRLSTKHQAPSAKLKGDSGKLYKLIFNRFVACQMRAQILDKNIVDIKASQYLLRAIGEREKFAGWKKLYGEAPSNEENILPSLTKGEILQLIKVLAEQKFTKPPARYSEGSLIKALEERGIGRPSTYASIISTIQTRQYVEKIEGRFQPTPVGETVNGFLCKYFANIIDYDFTAEMEDDLDKIAQGQKKWVPVLKEFFEPFAKKLKEVAEKAQRVKIEVEKIGKKCPKCKKGEQVIRVGRFGKFLSCSTFPDCDWKDKYIEKLKGVKCPDCTKDIVIRKTRKGKQFYGCIAWPKCKWASWRRPVPPKK